MVKNLDGNENGAILPEKKIAIEEIEEELQNFKIQEIVGAIGELEIEEVVEVIEELEDEEENVEEEEVEVEAEIEEQDEEEEDSDDEDDDIENETFVERVAALKDIIPLNRRNQVRKGISNVFNVTKRFGFFMGNAAWILSTTAVLILVPLGLELEKEQMLIQMENEQKLQQQAQQLLSPGKH